MTDHLPKDAMCDHTPLYVGDSVGRHLQVSCPWCKDVVIERLTAERDQYKLAAEMNAETIDKLRFTGEYGCHVELEPGQKPDGCVIDEGDPHRCVYAERLVAARKDKTACEYWQRIRRSGT